MAFVPQYTYDIFVSYAHVDDLPEPATQEGWVTTLVLRFRNVCRVTQLKVLPDRYQEVLELLHIGSALPHGLRDA
jgi:hypothetical protein